MGTIGAVLGIFSLIVMVGFVSVVVTHPQSSQIITSFGNAFANGLKVAMGGG